MRKMKKTFKAIIILLIVSLITSVSAMKYFDVARTSLTDSIQTIPPIIVSGPNAISNCNLLSLTPGSVVAGTSGFVQASCPNGTGAETLQGTETPTFTLLSTGWTQIVLMWYSNPCSFSFFSTFAHRLIGMNMTSNNPVAFTALSNSTTQLMFGSYNYCLFYQNPTANGIQTFTISWNP
jgi:hypothetical protein